MTTVKREDEILEILAQACARRELLILVTPYLRFESAFCALEGGELHALATMSREDVHFGLRTPILMRFPVGQGFMEAQVKTLGLGLQHGRRTLRLTIPKELKENDQRAAYRVERVGRVMVTYGTPKGDILQASLVDLSTQGVRIHAQRDVDPDRIPPGTILALSIPLLDNLMIEAKAEVRHLGLPRSIGLKFRPALPKAVEIPLARWVFQRQEEDRERLALLLEARARTPKPSGAASQPGEGILLVSGDAALEEELRAVLQPIQPLTRVPAAGQALKEALAVPPGLAIFHVAGASLDERRKVKGLMDLVQGRCPTLMVGTLIDAATLFELSGEWKASSALVWQPARGPFLQKLAQGILRRHGNGGESPMAPAEN